MLRKRGVGGQCICHIPSVAPNNLKIKFPKDTIIIAILPRALGALASADGS